MTGKYYLHFTHIMVSGLYEGVKAHKTIQISDPSVAQATINQLNEQANDYQAIDWYVVAVGSNGKPGHG